MKPLIAVILPNSLPIPPIKGGSIQTVVYDVLKGLNGFEIETFSKRVKGLPAQSVDEYQIRHNYLWDNWYHSLELESAKGFVVRFNSYIYRVCRQLAANPPAVIHIHNRPHYLPIVRKYFPKAKIIYTGHNLKIAEDSYNLKRIAEIADSMDEAIYCSNKVGELDFWHDQLQYRDKVSTIYNSVDVNRFVPSAQQDQAILKGLRRKYDLEGKKVVLFVGRLVEEKAAHNVIQAMKLVVKNDPEVVLLMVGSSFFEGAHKTDYIKFLEQSAQDIQQNVRFTGFISGMEMPFVYAIADVFVSPVNWDDPSPKTIYEAAATGLPIIATMRGGIPEIVVRDESAILLESPYENEQLVEQILKVLADKSLSKALGEKARKRMVDCFSIETITGKWQAAYQRLSN